MLKAFVFSLALVAIGYHLTGSVWVVFGLWVSGVIFLSYASMDTRGKGL